MQAAVDKQTAVFIVAEIQLGILVGVLVEIAVAAVTEIQMEIQV